MPPSDPKERGRDDQARYLGARRSSPSKRGSGAEIWRPRQTPFHINAWVVLPDHMRCLWTPAFAGAGCCPKRCRFSGPVARDQDRIRKIAADRRAAITGHDKPRRTWHLERRYWEHTIRDDRDLAAHLDHTHFNPVKHGLVAHPADWPYWSFRRCLASGISSRRLDRRRQRTARDWRTAVTSKRRSGPRTRPLP